MANEGEATDERIFEVYLGTGEALGARAFELSEGIKEKLGAEGKSVAGGMKVFGVPNSWDEMDLKNVIADILAKVGQGNEPSFEEHEDEEDNCEGSA